MKYTILFLDDERSLLDWEMFGCDCSGGRDIGPVEGQELFVRSFDNPDDLLQALQVGEVGGKGTVLFLDVNFTSLAIEHLRYTDPPTSNKDQWGLDVLRTVKRMDPDLPVIVLTSLPAQHLSFMVGRHGADDFINKNEVGLSKEDATEGAMISHLIKRIEKAITLCGTRNIYDHEHLETADEFAKDYDPVERSFAATIAYYHYENDVITKTISDLAQKSSNGRRLRILDVGCGPGRIEEHLARLNCGGELDVVGVDFSGPMLRVAQENLARIGTCISIIGEMCKEAPDKRLHVSLFRAPAEELGFLKECRNGLFDLVILGFGLLSYVRYAQVLPPDLQNEESSGLLGLLKPGGRLIFSVYNEDSAIYRRLAELEQPDEEMPIAALMDTSTGSLKVGENRFFACEAFTTKRIVRFLRQAGLCVSPESVTTFPTLHLMLNRSTARSFPADPNFPQGTFSEDVYKMDCDISRVLSGRGHYIVGVAEHRPVQNHSMGRG